MFVYTSAPAKMRSLSASHAPAEHLFDSFPMAAALLRPPLIKQCSVFSTASCRKLEKDKRWPNFRDCNVHKKGVYIVRPKAMCNSDVYEGVRAWE